jgi:hypothetical protein
VRLHGALGGVGGLVEGLWGGGGGRWECWLRVRGREDSVRAGTGGWWRGAAGLAQRGRVAVGWLG